MSRLIVKNIGKNTTDKQLRDLFSEKGEVTDVKVVKSDKGVSRKFAFVGFRTDLQATEAQKYFNNTFIGLSRIVVDIAKKVNDSSLQDMKDRHSKKHKKSLKPVAVEELKLPLSTEKKNGTAQKKQLSKNMAEFMDVMKSRKEALSWANDDGGGATEAAIEAQENELLMNASDSDPAADNDDSDSDESALDLRDGQLVPKDHGAKTLASDVKTDLDYLKSKRTADFSDSDSEVENDDSATKKQRNREKATSNAAVARGVANLEDVSVNNAVDLDVDTDFGNAEDAEESGDHDEDNSRLFIKNLPYSCTEDELTQLFETYGQISEVHIPLDTDRRSKGLGFVQYLFPEHARKALHEVAGSSFQGRLLRVEYAQRAPEQPKADQNKNSKLSSFQQKKEDERRKAVNNQQGWNSSFVRSDAVVAALADKYGVSHSDILDSEQHGGELAVRLAVGESQVIMDNKTFFKSHGVDISALESSNSDNRAAQRSTTTILIKNLPPSTVHEEIESMFARFGMISSFLIPKSNTLALVDFVEPSEARLAYKNLAYRAYKHQPLYLEWAPLGVIDSKAKAAASSATGAKSSTYSPADKPMGSSKSSDDIAEKLSTDKKRSIATVDDENDDDYFTLFIKNLNFVTTDESLANHLRALGVQNLRAVSIQKKTAGRSGNLISQGYGFAEFSIASSAKDAQTLINGSLLDSHTLEAKPSTKRITNVVAVSSSSAASNKSKTSGTKRPMSGSALDERRTKLIVRNVAFQASRKELLSLFSSFGSVKRVRIPKKMGGDHRGFAFVEFATAQEAEAAMASLTSTHLYGRHLVLEWAKEIDDDDDGEKVAEQRKKSRADERFIRMDKQSAASRSTVDMDGQSLGAEADLL